MIQYRIKEEVKVRKQKKVEKVQYFRYRRIRYYKQKYSNIEVEKKRRRQKETVYSIREKAQQQEEVRRMKLACFNWEKIQEYCRVENIPENVQLLELGWMTEEVITTYIECR